MRKNKRYSAAFARAGQQTLIREAGGSWVDKRDAKRSRYFSALWGAR